MELVVALDGGLLNFHSEDADKGGQLVHRLLFNYTGLHLTRVTSDPVFN